MAKPKKNKKEVVLKKTYSLEKTTVENEKEAIQAAMEELETFEGNLERNDTKTHYVFSKVRA